MRHGFVLRKAGKIDSGNLWLWRNHPEARKNFFNTKPTSWEEHKKWFLLAIKDKRIKIYIAQKRREKIGVVRFQDEQDLVRVSVDLNPAYFGKGLGPKIIKKGTERLLKETKRVAPIVAEIKKANVRSQKAFVKAGYKKLTETKKKVIYAFENT